MQVPFAAGLFQLFIGPDRRLAAGTAYGQLHGKDGNAHDDQKQQVEQNKDAAAVLAGNIGELPYVADADGAACAYQQKTKA